MKHFAITPNHKRISQAYQNAMLATRSAARLEGLGFCRAAMATRRLALNLTHQAQRYEAELIEWEFLARVLQIEREHGDWEALINGASQ